MIVNRQFVNEASGVRLDAALLSAFPSSTRAFVREAIESGMVTTGGTDGAAVRTLDVKGLKLRGGETIFVKELLEGADNHVRAQFSAPLHPVFKDASLLAFDKAPGVPVQPLSCRETGTLMNRVVSQYPECMTLGDSPLMAGAIHRIDADTSGLVLVARTAAAFENLRAQFAAQTVKKTYLALVEGHVAVGGTLEHDLIHDPTLPFCRMIDVRQCRVPLAKKKPLHAVTRFNPIGYASVECEDRTLLEVTIYTGVTHQIRAQLAMAGMHIVNDRLYGAFAVEHQKGHCLHALAAEFLHPTSGCPMEIRTPYPEWSRL